MIAVIDYGMGNVKSVTKAIEYIGADAVLTNKHTEIASASHIVLPGVGSFNTAYGKLQKLGLIELLNYHVLERKTPFLGICLGMQLLAMKGTEGGQENGLGWFNASVELMMIEEADLKLPHFGWNDVEICDPKHALFAGLGKQPVFYFAHSYAMKCQETKSIAVTANYGGNFVAAVLRDNIFATQFHPEKSQRDGLRLLENFIDWTPGCVEN